MGSPSLLTLWPVTMERTSPKSPSSHYLYHYYYRATIVYYYYSNPSHSQDVQECSMNEVDIGGSFDGTGWLLLRKSFFIRISVEDFQGRGISVQEGKTFFVNW